MDEKIKFLIGLSRIPRFGAKKLSRLQHFFPSVEAIWHASFSELQKVGWEAKATEEFIFHRSEIDLDLELAKLEKEKISAIESGHPDYPKLLKEIFLPPFLLYYRGDIKAASDFSLAVVGTRKPTNYGKLVAEQICTELLKNGFTIVSGLALGVDSIAHFSSIENKKPTVAVLGSGLDGANIYPAQNRSMAEQIINNGGVLISEFPLGTMPLRHNFPMRNRIISGLSLGTLVVEAGESSGALITADFALEQNREVFAIPGSILSPLSTGTNKLIKKGAKLVASVDDIIEELNISELKNFSATKEVLPDSPEEGSILTYLTEPRHINELVQLTALSISEINTALVLLEMKGQVKNLGNMTFAKLK